MINKKIKIVSVLLALSVGGLSIANAEDTNTKNKDTFKLSLGAFFITNSETTLGLDPIGVPGAVYVNLESQLGVRTENSVGRIEGYYRFNSRHRMDYGYYPISRGGTRSLAVEIPTNPPLPVGSSITTVFDTATYKLGYTYSFYHSDQVELGIGAGLHITSYDLSLTTTAGASKSASITTPLPVVNLLLNYNISPNWIVLYNTQVFFLQYDGSNGSLTDTNLAIEYRGFESFSFGLGYNRVSLSIEFSGEDYLGTVDNDIDGFTTYVAFYF